MRDQFITILAFIAALGSGVAGGVLFAFSSFVMAALARLPSGQGIAAMNAINVTVINPAFMLVFMGTAVVCVVLAGGAFFWLSEPAGKLLLGAALVYLAGCIGVTAAFNVPLNDQLATVDAPHAVQFWQRYIGEWTLWNHVRTAAAILAAALFTMALVAKQR